MSRICIGLDLSLTSAGVALIEGSRLPAPDDSFSVQWVEKGEGKSASGKSRSLTELQRIRRLRDVRDRIVSYVQSVALRCSSPLVAIEGYAFSKHSSSVTGLAELGGVVRCALLDAGLGVPVTLPVTQCRRFVLGSGKVSKTGVDAWLKQQGLTFATNDEADAYVVGLTGWYLVNPDALSALDQTRLDYLNGISKIVSRKHPEDPEYR